MGFWRYECLYTTNKLVTKCLLLTKVAYKTAEPILGKPLKFTPIVSFKDCCDLGKAFALQPCVFLPGEGRKRACLAQAKPQSTMTLEPYLGAGLSLPLLFQFCSFLFGGGYLGIPLMQREQLARCQGCPCHGVKLGVWPNAAFCIRKLRRAVMERRFSECECKWRGRRRRRRRRGVQEF